MSLWKTASLLEIKYFLLPIQHAHNGLDDEYNIIHIYIGTHTYVHAYTRCNRKT